MRNATCLFIVVFLATTCADEKDHPNAPLLRGSMLCQKPASEMQWLRDLVLRSESDMALLGDIYAGSIDGRIIFIHQPMVMSCLACVLYDCDGNKIEAHTIDHEKLRLIIDPKNIIYDAHPS